MAKKLKKDGGGGGKKGGGSDPIYKRASRQYRIGMRPYMQELKRQKVEGRQDTQEQVNRLGSIYGGLDMKLQQLEGDYGPQAQTITDQLQGDLGEWAGALGSVSPAGELAQAAGLLGNIGAGAMGEIGASQQRALDFNTSAQRQGAIEQATTQRNALTDLDQLLEDIRNRRLQAQTGSSMEIMERADQLRDFQRQMALANREYNLRRAMAEAQAGFLKQQLKFFNQPGNRNNRNNRNNQNKKPPPGERGPGDYQRGI